MLPAGVLLEQTLPQWGDKLMAGGFEPPSPLGTGQWVQMPGCRTGGAQQAVSTLIQAGLSPAGLLLPSPLLAQGFQPFSTSPFSWVELEGGKPKTPKAKFLPCRRCSQQASQHCVPEDVMEGACSR